MATDHTLEDWLRKSRIDNVTLTDGDGNPVADWGEFKDYLPPADQLGKYEIVNCPTCDGTKEGFPDAVRLTLNNSWSRGIKVDVENRLLHPTDDKNRLMNDQPGPSESLPEWTLRSINLRKENGRHIASMSFTRSGTERVAAWDWIGG